MGHLLERLNRTDVEVFLIGTTTTAPDPFFALNASFDPRYSGGANRTRLNEPSIATLLIKGMTTPEGPERAAVYKELWDSINGQHPWACISLAYIIIGMKDEFTGTEGIETCIDLRYDRLTTKEK